MDVVGRSVVIAPSCARFAVTESWGARMRLRTSGMIGARTNAVTIDGYDFAYAAMLCDRERVARVRFPVLYAMSWETRQTLMRTPLLKEPQLAIRTDVS